MARKAEQVHVADFQEMRIRRAVRSVAGLATFELHCLMLEHKRPALFHMAGIANRVLRRRSAHLLGLNRAVRIVTVVAFNQSLVDAMMEGHCELRLLRSVAGVAKFRLFFYEQEFGILAVVRRMAIQTAHIVLVVHGPSKIHLLFPRCVAGHTALVNRLRARRFKTKNLLRVARIIRVGRARPVAALAPLMRCAIALVQCCLKVRRSFVALKKILVADLAGFGADVSAIRSLSGRLRGRLRRLLPCGCQCSGVQGIC